MKALLRGVFLIVMVILLVGITIVPKLIVVIWNWKGDWNEYVSIVLDLISNILQFEQ